MSLDLTDVSLTFCTDNYVSLPNTKANLHNVM